MGAQNKLFHRLFWLIDTVYSAKRIKISEINKRWERSHYNDKDEHEYGARNLHRHREDIAELFGIIIDCDHATNEYFISSQGDIDGKGIRAWLIDTFAISNMVNLADGADMKSRIFFEEIPEGARFLSTIVSAMKEGRQLHASYQGYNRTQPHSFLLAPYCLKAFEHRWYLIGKPDDHPEEVYPRVYALDRMKELVQVDKPFDMPKSFKAEEFFKNQFGVDRSETEAQHIVVKITAKDANFMRTPLRHHTQKEIEKNDQFSIFSFDIAPTYDFILELRKFGSTLEVLEPQSLRDKFAEESASLAGMYKSKKPQNDPKKI